MAKLIVECAGDTREVRLTDPCRIGRDAENDIELKDAGASRRHCRVAKDGDGWILEDLRSANGTFKNEERIDRTRLADGDVIRVGTSTMRFVAADEDAGGVDEISLELEEPATGSAGSGFRLIGTLGEVRGKRVDIKPPRLTMGRKSTNTIPLNDTKVSGVHAEIVFENGKPILRDLGSTNGTFLEGKRIDEIALSHGDRFGLGECVFVVADVTQPEPALERDDNEGERTIVDAPAFRRVDPEMTAKRIEVKPVGSSAVGMLGLLVLVAGIAGAGWYAIDMKSKSKRVASAPAAADNLLGDRWSFETTDNSAPAIDWNLGVFGARFQVASGGSHSGEAHIHAAVEGDRPCAELKIPLDSANRRFAIKGFGRAKGGATALLGIEFRRNDDPSFHLATTLGSVTAGEWTEIAGEVVAPSDADRFVVQLVGAGSAGEVAFDDISVVTKGSERPQNQAVSAFEIERFGDSMLIRRNGETLMRILPLTLTAPPVEGEQAPRRFEGGMFRSGNQLFGPLGAAAQVETSIAPEAKKVTYRATSTFDSGRTGAAVLPVDLRGSLLDVDVYVVSEQRGLEPYRESFELNGVSALVVGKGATRMRIALDPPSQVKAIRDDARIALDIGLASGRPLSVVTQVDFVDEMVDATHARDDAQASFTRGAYGETLSKLRDIRSKYAFDESAVAAAESLKQKVEVEVVKLIRECNQAAERTRYLQSVAVFLEAERMASDAAAKLSGTEEGAAPAALAKELATQREALTADQAEQQAVRLLSRVKTALAQQPRREHIAKAILSHLELEYPTSAATAEARRLVDGK